MLKKIGGGVACVAFVLFMVWLGYERTADEIKKNEELKKQEQRDANRIAKDYVIDYTDSLQSAMSIAPFSDLQAKYRKVTRSEYLYGKEKKEIDDRESDEEYHYYYIIEYVSASAGEVYEQLTAGGSYSEYIDLMKQIRRARIKVEDEYKMWEAYETKINDKKIVVEIKDYVPLNGMTIKGTNGQKYEVSPETYYTFVLVNDEVVYKKEREASEIRRSYSKRHKSYHYDTDPYDVNDYDNPDDFAEEWANDFGDGDYDDGYDDAYDYWEDNRD